MSTTKISIAIDKQKLRRARAAAKEQGLSLSAFIGRALGTQLDNHDRLLAARALWGAWGEDSLPTEKDSASSSPPHDADATSRSRGMTPRVMLDTGALIALERRHDSMRRIHRAALEEGYTIAAITPVVAEWWRKGKREKERLAILRSLQLEAPAFHVARLAGEAVGMVGANVVDALVMAAASIRGDTVYTSDVDDLTALRCVFMNVEVVHA